MRRDTIEQFCREFFQNHNCKLRVIIRENKHMFTEFDMSMFTEENFGDTIQRIFMDLFTLRPVHEVYITAAMGFALEIDYHLQGLSWYQLDDLIDVIVNVLEKVGFNNSTNYISLLIDFIWYIVNSF